MDAGPPYPLVEDESMNRLKAFVCMTAGLVLLAAPLAKSQSSGAGTVAVVVADGGLALSGDGDLYEYTGRFGSEEWTFRGSIGPFASPPVSVYRWSGDGLKVMLENGDIYYWSPSFGRTLTGNVFSGGGPTPVEPSTWSGIKVGR